MCSTSIKQNMENYQGDLTDIIRASNSTTSEPPPATTNWQFPSDPMNYPQGIEDPLEDFGHPFSSFQDPLLQDLDIFSSVPTEVINAGVQVNGGFSGNIVDEKIVDEEMKIRPRNIFSRMLQISHNAKLPLSPCDSPLMGVSPRGLQPPALLASNDMISGSSSKGCLIENTGLQISSPRNTGIKRRKSQAKKVVCIPAPAPANSRPTGEIVPSDLWAWRKYGQKPIKGSPYPRGYYRCSSSKGCSARKQVERSRTDPNMLVITYTSEHNHPWPTQRNALAGSTRTQPIKNNHSSHTSKNSLSSHPPKVVRLKEEQKDIISSSMATGNSSVKEEMDEDLIDNKQIAMEDSDQFNEGFSYRPELPDSNHSDDFFADLGEIEADPMSLLFNQGFSAEEERLNNKASLDPFSFYDWPGNNNNNTNNSTNNNI